MSNLADQKPNLSQINSTQIKRLLIQMRQYVIHHEIGINECVAWCELKRLFDVGQVSDEADNQWLKENR